MVAPVARKRRAPTWKAAAGMGIAATVFFFVFGDPSRIPWLVVVLSLIYVAYLLRHEPLNKRHPRSRDDAVREALFAFGFTSLLLFSIGNFSAPDEPYVPFRMAITIGAAWGVVGYRMSRGFPQTVWRLLLTLLAVGLPITGLWVVGSKLVGG